jgi:catechol 2,3-dioxygenase-like lactoylglutathione lyase family enzyme
MNFADVTPNLIVADIDRSLAFYRDVLGFAVVASVPEQSPFVFVWLQRGNVHVFLNAQAAVKDELPAWSSQKLGGTNSLYVLIEADSPAEGVDALFQEIQPQARVAMPLKDQFYGMREFAVEDPDGYLLFFAQRTS